MAVINDQGNVQSRCPGCRGALSSFEWRTATGVHGAVSASSFKHRYWSDAKLDYRLFRCAGCGRGDIGVIAYGGGHYPGSYRELCDFHPEVRDRLQLPNKVPKGIEKEFREGEKCLEAGAIRAAAGMLAMSRTQLQV